MKFSDIANPGAARDIINRFNRNFSTKTCLSPSNDCSGPIIKAHSLSKEGMLRPISRDGHVYVPQLPNPFQPEKGIPTEMILKGIGDTSVFNGFCRKHDKELFARIEDEPFCCRPDQIFMHAYRAVAKESYLKPNMATSFPTVEEVTAMHNIPADEQPGYSVEALIHLASCMKGAEEFVELKTRMDGRLTDSSWFRLKTTVVQTREMPTISCSFAYAPDIDFSGRSLQDYSDFDQPLNHLMVTVLPSLTHGGFVLLSHLDDAGPAPAAMIHSLLAQADFTSSIIWLVLTYSENFAASPLWYDSLPKEVRSSLNTAFHSNTNPFADEPVGAMLLKRTLTTTSWGPSRVFAI